MLQDFRKIDVIWNRASDKIHEKIELLSSDELGRKLVVQVTNNGAEENMKGASLSLAWETKKQENYGLDAFTLVDESKGIYEIYFTTGMLSNIGKLKAHLHLVMSGSNIGAITSKEFGIKVNKGINTKAIESENSFTALTVNLSKIAGIEEDEKTRKSAESKRISAESTRVSNESTRVSNENTRKNSETQRGSAETGRANAESTRVSNENVRKNSESQRQSAETVRSNAETARSNAESTRVSNEDTRNSGENTRVSNENARKSNETQRQSAETNRQNAEGVRENKYNSAESSRNSQYNSAEGNRNSLYNQAEQTRFSEYAPRLQRLENSIPSPSLWEAESGQNENGNWIKRADGTMECWRTFTVSGTDKGTWGGLHYWSLVPKLWVFPQPFIETPTLSVTSEDLQFFWAISRANKNEAFAIDGYRGTGGTIDTVQVTVRATGLWSKAADGRFFKGADYPNYWESHINSKISQAMNLQNASLDAHSFVFVTDIHMSANDGYSFSLIRKAVHELGLQTIINGGDLANNNVGSLKGRTTDQIRTVVEGYAPIYEKTMMTMGNHDDNSISRLWAETMQHTELYKRIFSFMGNASVYGPTGKYHYRDDVFNKTRYIVLDSIDIPYIQSGNDLKYRGIHTFAYRQEQVDWLINRALVTPNGWSVVVVSHTPPYEGTIKGWDAPTFNEEIVRGLLKAYKEKRSYSASSKAEVPSEMKISVSADFRNRGGDVIAWFCGHVHYDNVVQLPEGFPLITTLNDGGTRWLDSPKRVSGTIAEQVFDIITVNKSTRKIHLTRVGAGNNRTVSY